jgi:hypothetical protein
VLVLAVFKTIEPVLKNVPAPACVGRGLPVIPYYTNTEGPQVTFGYQINIPVPRGPVLISAFYLSSNLQ